MIFCGNARHGRSTAVVMQTMLTGGQETFRLTSCAKRVTTVSYRLCINASLLQNSLCMLESCASSLHREEKRYHELLLYPYRACLSSAPPTENEFDERFSGLAFCECSQLAATRRPPLSSVAGCLPFLYFHWVKSGNFYILQDLKIRG